MVVMPLYMALIMVLATPSTIVASTHMSMAMTMASLALVLRLCITITVPAMDWELVAAAWLAMGK